jgi:hypothetical protein
MLASGKISDFSSPGGANASYTMTIPTPQLSCSERVVDISETDGVLDGEDIWHFVVDWIRESSVLVMPNLTITSVERLQWFQISEEEDSNSNETWVASGNATLLVCQPTLTDLVLNVTYVEGTRYITHRTENVQDFNPELAFSFNYLVEPNLDPADTAESKLWVAETRETVRIWNIWALLDAALTAIEFKCNGASILTSPFGESSMKNGTVALFNECLESGKSKSVAFNGIVF